VQLITARILGEMTEEQKKIVQTIKQKLELIAKLEKKQQQS
jgi:hypothetical protein